MQIPASNLEIIPTTSVLSDPAYNGLRIVRAQNDQKAAENFRMRAYQFQDPTSSLTPVRATLTRKGYVGDPKHQRIVAMCHPSLRQFIDLVRYDPAAPPPDDYNALGMKEAHERTQSDFKGQKAQNRVDFKEYILEGIRGNRTLYLPVISGWQSSSVFDQTAFVAFDESDPDALYGFLFLPKAPIMQADGQTQTAAEFAVAQSKDAVEQKGALDQLRLTLEIELNVDERSAGQSFADRNGRGSKKNKNLVINLDTSSALSDLRLRVLKGTIFETRLATGRNTGTSETATTNIVDLSTMEQMLLDVVSEGKRKPEHFKHFHVEAFLPYATEFIHLLESSFGKDWSHPTPTGQDPFRRLYVHAWPYALKAIAIAYHRARFDKLGPLAASIGAKDTGKKLEDAFMAAADKEGNENAKKYEPEITIDELKRRLAEVDWLRYRAHWISLTGYNLAKDGKKKTVKLKTGDSVVVGQAQNTAAIIHAVATKLLSDTWKDLTATIDETP
jgi:hypothetical protein